MGMKRRRYPSLPFWVLLAITASRALALSPALSIDQYLHSSWAEIDGKPFPDIHQLGQAADGYLWMGSATGLLRFDGIRFSAGLPRGNDMPATMIRGMAPASQGGLWILTKGAVTRIYAGGTKQYPIPVVEGRVGGLFEDTAGDLWMLFADQTHRTVEVLSSKDGKVRSLGTADGLPEAPPQSLVADGDSLWLGTKGGLCRWRPGRAAVCQPIPGRIESIFRVAPNQVIAASETTVVRATGNAGNACPGADRRRHLGEHVNGRPRRQLVGRHN